MDFISSSPFDMYVIMSLNEYQNIYGPLMFDQKLLSGNLNYLPIFFVLKILVLFFLKKKKKKRLWKEMLCKGINTKRSFAFYNFSVHVLDA